MFGWHFGDFVWHYWLRLPFFFWLNNFSETIFLWCVTDENFQHYLLYLLLILNLSHLKTFFSMALPGEQRFSHSELVFCYFAIKKPKKYIIKKKLFTLPQLKKLRLEFFVSSVKLDFFVFCVLFNLYYYCCVRVLLVEVSFLGTFVFIFIS